MSGSYSQGWEDGDQMVALPIALTAPSLSMETVVSGPSTYIHTYRIVSSSINAYSHVRILLLKILLTPVLVLHVFLMLPSIKIESE